MIILSKNSIFTYESNEILDLMNPPAPNSANNLYANYFNFINNTIAIYDTQNNIDNIPVFVTRIVVENNIEKRIPDSNSTLQRLIPGNSYRIIVVSDTSLPLNIPNPLSLEEFGKQDHLLEPISDIQISSSYTNNTITLNSNTLSQNIILSISQMLPYETYSYSVTPVFSNWPAKISPTSGNILSSGPVTNNYVSGYIESIFSYYSYISDNLDSIPYVLNGDINKTYYNNNIFSIINIKIYFKNKVLYDNNFIIRCNECVPQHQCPSLSITGTTNKLQNFIHGSVSGLVPNISYNYIYQNINGNWPAYIFPLSGTIFSKDIKNGIANLHSVLTFCLSPDDKRNNLDYKINPYETTTVLNSNLELKLIPINNSHCNNISSNTLSIQYSLPDHSLSNVKFNEQTGTRYPVLGKGTTIQTVGNSSSGATRERPTAEISMMINNGGAIASGCQCNDGYPILATLNNLKPNEEYTYVAEATPDITLIESSGKISPSSSSYILSLLAFADGSAGNRSLSSSILLTVTHSQSQKSFSDSIIVRCVPTGLIW